MGELWLTPNRLNLPIASWQALNQIKGAPHGDDPSDHVLRDKPAKDAGPEYDERNPQVNRILGKPPEVPFSCQAKLETVFTILGSRNILPVTLLLVIVFCTAGPAKSTSRLEYLDHLGFTVGSKDNQWLDYEIIIWQPQTATRLAGLARLGVTAGKIFGDRGADGPDVARIPEETAPFRSLHLRWYIENIVTDFYSAYHRWQAGHPVNWLFDEVQRLHRQEPENPAAFVRSPSLSDPEWLDRAAQRLERHVRAYAPLRPLYYSLADEPGIADLGAAWDFDLDPASLAGMRVWLRRRYRTLDALNREWGTRFPEWGAVLPITTDEALHRSDENFSSWADFKEWMDIAFARAVRLGTDAVHAADPQARAALEGAQIPGWGGYDFSQLGGAVDVMEMYDSGNNVEISQSLFPKLITLSTSFGMDDEQIHGVWHELLLGGRGSILWDEGNQLVHDDGTPTEQGQSLGTLAGELCSGLAAQIIASTSDNDPVAILYSPESFRIQWLLDRKADGKPWAERRSETEGEANVVRATAQRAAQILTHLGLQPRWLTSSMIEHGILEGASIHVLILPHTISLSPSASRQIRAFARAGGIVLADSEPGLFDAHGRRFESPPLAGRIGADGPIRLMPELREDAAPGDPTPLLRWRQILLKAGVTPRVTLSGPDSGTITTNIDARLFRNGRTTVIGLQRDWTNASPKVSQDVELRFNAPVYVYNLRQPGTPQHTARVRLVLDAIAPALIAVSSAPLSAVTLAGPSRARLGTVATISMVTSKVELADERIVHIEAIMPDGVVAPAYTTNLPLHGGHSLWRLPLPLDGPAGNWTIRVNDVLSGQRIEHPITVLAP